MIKREVKEIFAKRLKFYRKSKNMTQEQLAELIGTTAQTLSGLESKYNFPSISMLNKIINALEVQPYEMFLDEGEELNLDIIETQLIVIQKLNCLDTEKQKMILTIIDALSDKKEY